MKQRQNFHMYQSQSHEHLQEYHHGVRRHLSEVQQEVRVQQVGSREEVENLRHELSQSQSLAEGSHYQNLHTTSRSGAKVHQKVRHCDKITVVTWKPKQPHVQARLVLLKRKLRKFLS